MIIDAHATIGRNRDIELDVDQLLASMDALGIDLTLVSPPDATIAVGNHHGNELVASAAERSSGRLRPYAVASPWLGKQALGELHRARERGAVALKVDPALQGFDLLDGLIDPLLEFAADAGWPVYVRTGTPPHALPLQLAVVARRHSGVAFLMGKSGATDFSADGPIALTDADNLYADSAYVEWPTRLLRERPMLARGRVILTTDAPFADAELELARVVDAGLMADVRSEVLGVTMAGLLGL